MSSCAGADTDRWTSDFPADMSTNTHTSRLLYALMRCKSLTAADWACGVWNHQSTSLETHTHTDRARLKIACMQSRSSTTAQFSQTQELANDSKSQFKESTTYYYWYAVARVLCQETAIITACECAYSAPRRRQGGLKRSEAWCCHWIPRAQSSRLLGRQQLPHAHYHLAVWRRASAALWIEYYCSEHAHTSPSEKLLSQLWEPTTNALPSSLFSFLLSTLFLRRPPFLKAWQTATVISFLRNI